MPFSFGNNVHITWSLITFSASIIYPSFSHFVCSAHCFSWRIFLSAFLLSQDVPIFLFSSHGRIKVPGIHIFYQWVIWWYQLLVTLFHVISLPFMRFLAFLLRTTFQLPPVFFTAVLKLLSPHIHLSGLAQFVEGWLFLSGWRCIFFLSANFIL